MFKGFSNFAKGVQILFCVAKNTYLDAYSPKYKSIKSFHFFFSLFKIGRASALPFVCYSCFPSIAITCANCSGLKPCRAFSALLCLLSASLLSSLSFLFASWVKSTCFAYLRFLCTLQLIAIAFPQLPTQCPLQ